jgi:hypothetical protein
MGLAQRRASVAKLSAPGVVSISWACNCPGGWHDGAIADGESRIPKHGREASQDGGGPY